MRLMRKATSAGVKIIAAKERARKASYMGVPIGVATQDFNVCRIDADERLPERNCVRLGALIVNTEAARLVVACRTRVHVPCGS